MFERVNMVINGGGILNQGANLVKLLDHMFK